jgi:hypothetical protein
VSRWLRHGDSSGWKTSDVEAVTERLANAKTKDTNVCACVCARACVQERALCAVMSRVLKRPINSITNLNQSSYSLITR